MNVSSDNSPKALREEGDGIYSPTQRSKKIHAWNERDEEVVADERITEVLGMIEDKPDCFKTANTGLALIRLAMEELRIKRLTEDQPCRGIECVFLDVGSMQEASPT